MAKRPPLVNDSIYHIYNRGLDRRNIFLDDEDYLRFIHDLFEFNDTAPAGKFSQEKQTKQQSEVQPPKVSRDIFVEVVCFTLMPNHFHLVLKQKQDGGISSFMQKINTGYTMYFNEKYKRKGAGPLFQGRFKAVLVESEAQLMYLAWYIFTNPIEILQKNWKEKGVENPKDTISYLEKYRWSSYLDCIGKKNFPSVTSRETLIDSFGGSYYIRKFMEERIMDYKKTKEDLGRISPIILD